MGILYDPVNYLHDQQSLIRSPFNLQSSSNQHGIYIEYVIFSTSFMIYRLILDIRPPTIRII